MGEGGWPSEAVVKARTRAACSSLHAGRAAAAAAAAACRDHPHPHAATARRRLTPHLVRLQEGLPDARLWRAVAPPVLLDIAASAVQRKAQFQRQFGKQTQRGEVRTALESHGSAGGGRAGGQAGEAHLSRLLASHSEVPAPPCPSNTAAYSSGMPASTASSTTCGGGDSEGAATSQPPGIGGWMGGRCVVARQLSEFPTNASVTHSRNTPLGSIGPRYVS